MVRVNNQTSRNLYTYFVANVGSTSNVIGSTQPPSVFLKTINGVPQPAVVIKKNNKYNFHGPYTLLIVGKELNATHVSGVNGNTVSNTQTIPVIESFGMYTLTSGDQLVYFNSTGNDVTIGSGTELTKAVMWSFLGLSIALFIVLIVLIVFHFTSHTKTAKDDMKLSASIAKTIEESHAHTPHNNLNNT